MLYFANIINQSINQPINQSINQSINQPTNQSINQSISKTNHHNIYTQNHMLGTNQMHMVKNRHTVETEYCILWGWKSKEEKLTNGKQGGKRKSGEKRDGLVRFEERLLSGAANRRFWKSGFESNSFAQHWKQGNRRSHIPREWQEKCI